MNFTPFGQLKSLKKILIEVQYKAWNSIWSVFMKSLDKNSPVPLYYQLYTILLNQIQAHELKPGDMLPTELALVEQYNISRSTARQAIMDLVRNGYVVREKSKGTFVQDHTHNVQYSGRLKGFSAISREQGIIELTTKVIECSVIDPPKVVQGVLKLADGEKVFYLKRLRSILGIPNTYVEDWIPYRLCMDIEKIDFTNLSLYDTLEKHYGVLPNHATREFDSCYADSEEQIKELNIRKNTPLLRCTSRVYDAQNNPMEYFVSLTNGKFTVQEG